MRRATGVLPGQLSIDDEFQSTLSVRRATLAKSLSASDFIISIHALREESDSTNTASELSPIAISIHALREESDLIIIFLL